jgi:pseudouridine synthase
MASKIRLNKYISRCGAASRRKADAVISAGKVRVNGKTVRRMGVRIDADSDIVEVDGRVISPAKKEYIMLHKPPGILVSRGDNFGRPTILELIPPEMRFLFPVGRLDRDSEGLLILTNDGELAHRLMHPSYKVTKDYIIEVRGHPEKNDLKRLRKGVVIDGRPAVPDEVRVLKNSLDATVFKVKLHEGRKREIRRIFDAVGYRVIKLRRVSFDGLHLGRLKPGKWRRLKPEEIRRIKAAAGLFYSPH